MKKISKVMQEIIALTASMEANQPELYKTLEETPLFLGNSTGGDVTTHDLENYLNTLKEELHQYMKTHNKVK